MKKILLLVLLCPIFLFGQTQIGETIVGEYGQQLGRSVALSSDGTILAIGVPIKHELNTYGSISIYERTDNNQWIQTGSIYGNKFNDDLGFSLSLSSDGSILAASGSVNGGKVSVYEKKVNGWFQIGSDIPGKFNYNSYDRGYQINLSSDGTVLAVGEPYLGSIDISDYYLGYATIYRRNEHNEWIQLGETLSDKTKSFGWSLSLSSKGDIVAVGSLNTDNNNTPYGVIRVYKINADNEWIQIGQDIEGYTYRIGDDFGESFGFSIDLSSDGSTLAISSPFSNMHETGTGVVQLYERDADNQWIQIGEDIVGTKDDANLGYSVRLNSNNDVVVIASFNHFNKSSKGVHMYKRDTNNKWNYLEYKDDKNILYWSFYDTLSISSDASTVAIGSPSNISRIGFVEVYDFNQVLSTKENNITENFTIYPNPAKNQITLDIQDSILKQVKIYNNLGQLIKESVIKTINISNLSKGIYFVKVETDQGKSIKKLIIE